MEKDVVKTDQEHYVEMVNCKYHLQSEIIKTEQSVNITTRPTD